MKNLAIAGIALLLVYLSPLRYQSDSAQALWGLGLLLMTGYMLQQLAESVRVPKIAAWLVAGIGLGDSGLGLVQPLQLSPMMLVWTLAALGVGLRAGLYVFLPARSPRRVMVVVFLLTVVTAVLVAVAFSGAFHLDGNTILLLGALACFWGPFAVTPTPARRSVLSLAVIGAASSLLVLSVVLSVLEPRGLLDGGAGLWLARLWGSVLLGVGAAAVVRRAGLFGADSSTSTLAVRLMTVGLAGAVVIYSLGLFGLPCGLGAGLVFAGDSKRAQHLRFQLRAGAPTVHLLFFGLMGASINLGGLWPLDSALRNLVLVQLGAVMAIRGLGLALLGPWPGPGQGARRVLGGMLLPRGALLFELAFHPQYGLLSLLDTETTAVLRHVMLLDILVHLLLLGTLAVRVEWGGALSALSRCAAVRKPGS